MAAKPLAWERRYLHKLFWTDTLVVIFTVFSAQVVVSLALPAPDWSAGRHTVFSTALVLVWLIALVAYDTRNPVVFGSGPEEYKRIITATLSAFGLVALLSVLTVPRASHRSMFYIVIPCGLVLIVFGRWLWRKRLQQQRKRKRNTYRTLVVGDHRHSVHTIHQLRSNTVAGYELVGAVSDQRNGHELVPGLPIVADYDALIGAVDEYDIDALIVTSSNVLTPRRVRRIGWELEERNVDLIVTAQLTDIAGPRIHVRPVAGLPLIHVEPPAFSGWRYYAKRLSDVIGAVLFLVPAGIVMIALAVAIRNEDSGPILFKQTRLGLDGKPFDMYKLRSMREGAEDELPGLLDRSEGNEVLFKIKSDPRVTRVGQFMRRHSLDELPQLFNVLRGEMSLVGPRPPLPREVTQYDDWVSRRLLVRPGISGLWQVSGRSNLSWDESVRLDLFYVENWSLTGDLLILWRTLRTVFKPEGAY